MLIETVGAYRAQWGEGPVWWKNSLLYVDIEKHRVIRFDPATGEERIFEVGQRVGTIVPRKQGGMVFAGDTGFLFLDEDGTITPIGDPEPDTKPDNRFNDGKCSPDGRFFAGTISLTKKTGTANLYRLDPDLSIHKAYGPVTNSNGLIWSADGATMYYIDTPTKQVLAFDYRDGLLTNARPVISTAPYDASPDGMTIDSEGRLWIAFCHGAAVACYDPDTGRELQRIHLPCLETTACAFGGPDLADLYITTGIHSKVEEPDAGRLFVIRGLDARGVPAMAFDG